MQRQGKIVARQKCVKKKMFLWIALMLMIYLINSSVIGFENAPNSLTCVTIRKNNILNLKKIYRRKERKKRQKCKGKKMQKMK